MTLDDIETMVSEYYAGITEDGELICDPKDEMVALKWLLDRRDNDENKETRK